MSTALISRDRWAVDDPFIDFLIYLHDTHIYKQMREFYMTIRIKLPATITLDRDGDQFFFLLGSNIQEGVAGFGCTVDEALQEFRSNLAEEGVIFECK